MLHLRKIELLASVVMLSAVMGFSPAIAQNAPADIRLPADGAVPETDANLDGIDDSEQTTDAGPPIVIFDGGNTDNDRDDDSRDGDGQDRFDGLDGDRRDSRRGGRNDGGLSDGARRQLRRGANFDVNNGTSVDGNTGDGNIRARRAQQVGTIQPDGSVIPLANVPATRVQGSDGNPDAAPFAPLGIRVGTFTLLPVITQRLGATSNADFADGGASSAFSQTDAQLTATSDWDLHQLQIQLDANYQKFFNNTSDDLPNFTATTELRLDHTRALTSRYGVSYNLTTESAISDNLTVPAPLFVQERPDVNRYGGFAEVNNNARRINTTIRGTIARTDYEDASLSDGSTLLQDDRTNTLYEIRGRLGYEASPIFQPFVEGTYGFRNYSLEVDRNGNRRDSDLFTIRGGLAFNRGDKFNGQIALGYSSEKYDDDAIDDLNGLIVEADINWSPQTFTVVNLNTQTAFTGSTNVNEAGSVTYATTLGITHDLRPNLSLNASVLASYQDFDTSGRNDKRVQFAAGAEWRLNRSISILADLGYENVDSTDAGSSYDAFTGSLGVRLQR